MGCSTDACFSVPRHMQANPDIAGIGVIFAFLAPGWVGLVVSVISALGRQSSLPRNRLDAILSDYAQGFSSRVSRLLNRDGDLQTRSSERSSRLGPACSEAAVTLADLQLVTGTAILATACTQICTLTTYHFSIAYCIALTALSTLQCTSSVARDLYRERGILKVWRVAWLTCFVVLLLVAGVFWSGISRFYSKRRYSRYWMNFAYPIHCQWALPRSEKGDHGGFAPVIDSGLFILTATGVLSSFLRIISFLFSSLDWIHGPLDRILLAPSYGYLRIVKHFTIKARESGASVDASAEKMPSAPLVLRMASRILAAFCLASLTVLRSTCMDNTRALGILLFCHIQVWFEKMGAEQFLTSDEDQWGFGQILPMLLLVVPLFTLMSAFKKPATPSEESEHTETRGNATGLPCPATVQIGYTEKQRNKSEVMHPAQVFDSRIPLQARLKMLEEELFIGHTFEISVLSIAAAAIGGVSYAASYGVAI